MDRIGIAPLQALPTTLRVPGSASAPAQGPAERELLRDATSLSFRFKAALTDRMNRIDDHHPRLWAGLNRIMVLFQPIPDSDRPGNMGTVVPGLLRGEQPSQRGFQFLAQQGVRTVVNLSEGKNRDAAWAAAAGVRSVHIPEHNFDAPTLAQAQAFLRTVTNPANQPVYFHCYHGSDRTGTMAAVYRIAVQGWSAEQAIAELGQYHFNTPWEMAKLQFIHDFAAQWRGRAAELLLAAV